MCLSRISLGQCYQKCVFKSRAFRIKKIKRGDGHKGGVVKPSAHYGHISEYHRLFFIYQGSTCFHYVPPDRLLNMSYSTSNLNILVATFKLDWIVSKLYASAPFSIILMTISKVILKQAFRPMFIPYWQSHNFFPVLIQCLVDYQVEKPATVKSLILPIHKMRQIFHQNQYSWQFFYQGRNQIFEFFGKKTQKSLRTYGEIKLSNVQKWFRKNETTTECQFMWCRCKHDTGIFSWSLYVVVFKYDICYTKYIQLHKDRFTDLFTTNHLEPLRRSFLRKKLTAFSHYFSKELHP